MKIPRTLQKIIQFLTLGRIHFSVGDVKSDLQVIVNNQYLDIRPPSGEEWVIHNIYHAGDVELYFWSGTDSILIDSASGAGAWCAYFWHVTNTVYLRVMNVSGGDIAIGYDGIQTK